MPARLAAPHTTAHPARDRLAQAFLIAVMAVGCLVLWIGIPVGVLYGTARVVDTNASHFVLALPTTLIAMIAFARALFWVNRLYLRVGESVDAGEEWEHDEGPAFARGPLEPMLVAAMLVALLALFVWFFGFAHNPSQQVI